MEVLDSLSGIRVYHEEYAGTQRATLSIEINGSAKDVREAKERLKDLLVDAALRTVYVEPEKNNG